MSSSLARYMATLFAITWLSSSGTPVASESEILSNTGGIVDYELSRVEFLPGRPAPGDSFENSAKFPSADQVRLLEADATFIMDMPDGLGAEVIGSTDTHECFEPDCRALSLRRAKCAYDWLLNHGVPVWKLKGPKGDANDYPIGDNETEEGRQYNRRVQFDFVSTK